MGLRYSLQGTHHRFKNAPIIKMKNLEHITFGLYYHPQSKKYVGVATKETTSSAMYSFKVLGIISHRKLDYVIKFCKSRNKIPFGTYGDEIEATKEFLRFKNLHVLVELCLSDIGQLEVFIGEYREGPPSLDEWLKVTELYDETEAFIERENRKDNGIHVTFSVHYLQLEDKYALTFYRETTTSSKAIEISVFKTLEEVMKRIEDINFVDINGTPDQHTYFRVSNTSHIPVMVSLVNENSGKKGHTGQTLNHFRLPRTATKLERAMLKSFLEKVKSKYDEIKFLERE